MTDELIGWGYQGGHRFWNTLQDYIAEIEYGYQGPQSVPTKLHLRLCGKKDYRFYDNYDFRFGLVNDFLRGLKVAAGLGADENLVLPTIEGMLPVASVPTGHELTSVPRCTDVCRSLIERVHPIDRVYLAKSAVVPLPYFCHHIPTVLLATLDDECYYDADPRINHGLAVMSVERWMSALDPRGSAPVAPLPPLPLAPKKMILPISGKSTWSEAEPKASTDLLIRSHSQLARLVASKAFQGDTVYQLLPPRPVLSTRSRELSLPSRRGLHGTRVPLPLPRVHCQSALQDRWEVPKRVVPVLSHREAQ